MKPYESLSLRELAEEIISNEVGGNHELAQELKDYYESILVNLRKDDDAYI